MAGNGTVGAAVVTTPDGLKAEHQKGLAEQYQMMALQQQFSRDQFMVAAQSTMIQANAEANKAIAEKLNVR